MSKTSVRFIALHIVPREVSAVTKVNVDTTGDEQKFNEINWFEALPRVVTMGGNYCQGWQLRTHPDLNGGTNIQCLSFIALLRTIALLKM